MNLKYSNVYVISELVERKSLDTFFWPEEYRKYKRQKLIDQNKREAWFCNFLNSGLLLDTKIIISKKDYVDWPENYRTANPNTIKSELNYYESFELNTSVSNLKISHPASIAELIRKKIYISKNFLAKAHNIWAAQYFEPNKPHEQMVYELGFNREIEPDDNNVINLIKNDICKIEGLKFYNNG